jgi:hypothetical protein
MSRRAWGFFVQTVTRTDAERLLSRRVQRSTHSRVAVSVAVIVHFGEKAGT